VSVELVHSVAVVNVHSVDVSIEGSNTSDMGVVVVSSVVAELDSTSVSKDSSSVGVIVFAGLHEPVVGSVVVSGTTGVLSAPPSSTVQVGESLASAVTVAVVHNSGSRSESTFEVVTTSSSTSGVLFVGGDPSGFSSEGESGNDSDLSEHVLVKF
jgi:hypothetical protein